MKLLNMPATFQGERVLITGMPGSGKSTLAAKLSEKYKLHWIDTERGMQTLRRLPQAWQENITYYNLPDSATVPMAAETLLILFKQRKIHMCDLHGKHNCPLCAKDTSATFSDLDLSKIGKDEIVVLDSISQLAASLLAHLMRASPVETKPERDDWGALRKYTEFFCSQFQAAEFNFVAIAHVMELKLADKTTKLVPNFGSGPASLMVGGKFDDIVYCAQMNKRHVAYSSSTALPTVITKSRLGIEIEKLPEPSLLPFFDRTQVAA